MSGQRAWKRWRGALAALALLCASACDGAQSEATSGHGSGIAESTDPDIQRKRQAWLMENASDPARAREFMLERAMLNVLRESLEAA